MLSITRRFSFRPDPQPQLNRADILDGNGYATLHMAAQRNQVAKIEELMRKNAGGLIHHKDNTLFYQGYRRDAIHYKYPIYNKIKFMILS